MQTRISFIMLIFTHSLVLLEPRTARSMDSLVLATATEPITNFQPLQALITTTMIRFIIEFESLKF